MSAIGMVLRFIIIEKRYKLSATLSHDLDGERMPAGHVSGSFNHTGEADVCWSRQQLVQRRLRLFQIARVEPLSEPPVNRSK